MSAATAARPTGLVTRPGACVLMSSSGAVSLCIGCIEAFASKTKREGLNEGWKLALGGAQKSPSEREYSYRKME